MKRWYSCRLAALAALLVAAALCVLHPTTFRVAPVSADQPAALGQQGGAAAEPFVRSTVRNPSHPGATPLLLPPTALDETRRQFPVNVNARLRYFATLPAETITYNQRLKEIRECIAAGADVNQPDQNGVPLLTNASNSSADSVATLLQAGANVNQSCRTGYTALHIAANIGRAEICQVLFSARR